MKTFLLSVKRTDLVKSHWM